MKKIIFIFSILFFVIGCWSDPAVDSVKNGALSSCPEKTVGQMAEGFMSSPSWTSLVADDGKTYVNLEGGITVSEKPVTSLIQFLVSDDLDTFEFNALEFNGVPQNTIMAVGLLSKMCEE